MLQHLDVVVRDHLDVLVVGQGGVGFERLDGGRVPPVFQDAVAMQQGVIDRIADELLAVALV